MNAELQSVVPRSKSSLGSFPVWGDGQNSD